MLEIIACIKYIGIIVTPMSVFALGTYRISWLCAFQNKTHRSLVFLTGHGTDVTFLYKKKNKNLHGTKTHIDIILSVSKGILTEYLMSINLIMGSNKRNNSGSTFFL